MKQTDIYTEALTCLRSILLADHPEFQNWIDWLERDIQDWTQRREVAHHLRGHGWHRRPAPCSGTGEAPFPHTATVPPARSYPASAF